jgi:protein-S-isoprenylcysteine O-methyltransferase Ste14
MVKMFPIVKILFYINIFDLFILMLGLLWSVFKPDQRIWPPPGKSSWQYILTWILFYLAFGLNTLLIILDWNNWIFPNPLRFLLGIPLILIGGSLLIWGIHHLGLQNTSGTVDGFIKTGPYRFTRNPQYLGDMILFLGLSIITNSVYLWITHILLILVLLITPLAEEECLRKQYGDDYLNYLEGTSRFL